MPTPQNVITAWNMTCPECGDDDQIDIAAIVHVRLCINGTDVTEAENGDHHWDDNSEAKCCACGHVGTVAEFTAAAGAR